MSGFGALAQPRTLRGCANSQVMVSQNGAPQAFRWQGQLHRVLALESIWTRGAERRYRVRSIEGSFELALDVRTGGWHLCRTPNWLERRLSRWQNGPRYPLPAWRRRSFRPSIG